MKNFNSFIEEIQEINDLEELEYGADLFNHKVCKGECNRLEVDKFNKVYWQKKDRLLADIIYDKNSKSKFFRNHIKIWDIIRAAPNILKDENNIDELKEYIKKRLRALSKKVAV